MMSPITVVVPPPPGASPHSTVVVLETANVATSVSVLGIVGGVQFSAVFQSLLVAFKFHVALPACSVCVPVTIARTASILVISVFIPRLYWYRKLYSLTSFEVRIQKFYHVLSNLLMGI